MAQVIFSERTGDSGAAADPDNSGYQRIMLSPGIECSPSCADPLRGRGVSRFYQNFTGNQLAAPVLFKVILSFMF